jgi:hypothetical protein
MVPRRQLQAYEFKKKTAITENDTILAMLLPITQFSEKKKVKRAYSSTQILKMKGT